MFKKNKQEKNEKSERQAYILLAIICQTLLTFATFEWICWGGFSLEIFDFGENLLAYAGYSIVTIFALYMFIYFLANDLRWGAILHVLLTFVAVAESTVYAARKEFIEYYDLAIASSWKQAVSDANITVWREAAISIVACIVMYIFIFKFNKTAKIKRDKKSMIIYAAGAILSILFLCIFYIQITKYHYVSIITNALTDEGRGAILTFGESVVLDNMVLDSDTDLYQEALDYYEDDENTLLATEENVDDIEVKPNIIVIMSEALWDVNQLSDIMEFSINPMEEFDKIATDYVSGVSCTNVFGGGTNQSEFEFLTGFNVKYILEASAVYETFLTDQSQGSIVQYLSQLGYSTYAIHPYVADFWNRSSAYENMGFDAFYHMDNMVYTDKEYTFISDTSLTNEIIYHYEEAKSESDAPVFSFSVSIANHVNTLYEDTAGLSYTKTVDITYKIDSTKIEDDYLAEIDRYVNGLVQSGEALAELVEYFSNVAEPTIILVYGDHAPSFLTELEGYLSNDIVDNSFYETPFYVWNNFGLDDFGVDHTNISYLSTYLLEYADLPLTKQALLNKYLSASYTVDTCSQVLDENLDSINVLGDSYITHASALYSLSKNMLEEGTYDAGIWTVFD